MPDLNYRKVYSANGDLQAANIQSALEKAGVPVVVTHDRNDAYLNVLVPEVWVEEALHLLFPERCIGERLLIPAGALDATI
jgi:hypothetical protein